MPSEVITFQDITGISATGSVDSVTQSVSVALTGVDLSGIVGTIIGYGWGAVPDTPESWTAQSDNSETWTPVSDSSESWTPVSDTSENWSEIAENEITWQEAA